MKINNRNGIEMTMRLVLVTFCDILASLYFFFFFIRNLSITTHDFFWVDRPAVDTELEDIAFRLNPSYIFFSRLNFRMLLEYPSVLGTTNHKV